MSNGNKVAAEGILKGIVVQVTLSSCRAVLHVYVLN